MAGGAALSRFLAAQAPVFQQALAELRAGRKRSHWMWFVLPQIAGLGMSAMSQRYAIADLAEARAYLSEPTLGPRLLACVAAASDSGEADPVALFGPVDAAKFRSCLTLFELAAEDPRPFAAALDRFYDGARDPETLRLLRAQGAGA